jgi:anti-sigma B factor antagonist
LNPDLRVAVQQADGPRALLVVTGEIDYHSVQTLTRTALELIDQGRTHLLLDLSGVGFCDSSGLNAMVLILNQARTRDGSLALACAPPRLQALLALTGVDKLIPNYPAASAARALRKAGRGAQAGRASVG